MIDLSNQTALVTGASRGIGRATALKLAAAGARVLVHYASNAEAADEVVAAIVADGGRAEAIAGDLAATDGAHELAGKVRALGIETLDILVANAGIAIMKPFEDETIEDFDRQFALNVRAPFFLSQQLLPLLKDGSRVIFVSSVVARAAFEGMGSYAATKGAIETIVRNLAATYGPRGIRVNAVAPGAIETDLAAFLQSETIRANVVGQQALKRVGQPDDIADVVLLLVSDLARWIDGRIVEASGGSRL